MTFSHLCLLRGLRKLLPLMLKPNNQKGFCVLLSDVAAEESACALVAALITYLLGLAL